MRFHTSNLSPLNLPLGALTSSSTASPAIVDSPMVMLMLIADADAVAGLMKFSLKLLGQMRQTSIRCRLVPIDVYIEGRRLITLRIACEPNGCVEALSSMRRDAEVAPKCQLTSLVIRKENDSLERALEVKDRIRRRESYVCSTQGGTFLRGCGSCDDEGKLRRRWQACSVGRCPCSLCGRLDSPPCHTSTVAEPECKCRLRR